MPTDTASRLQQSAQAFRDALESSNQAAADRMARGWASGLQRVELEVQSLMAKMEAARLAGVKVNPAWLYQERRLAALVDQMSDELARWAPLAEETIRRNAYQAASDAQDQAKRLTREAARASLPGVEASFTDLSPENMASILGHLAPGGPLRDLLGSLALGAVQAAEDAILQGVILGKGSAWITRNLAKALDVPRWRAETIARTEALRAYRETSRLTYQKSNVVGTWVWTAALDRRTCPACLALHGQEFSLEENLDGHPRCRCAMVPRTLSWADINPALADLPDTRPTIITGEEWLKGQGPATQRAVLGPGKFARYQRGTPLGDFVARTHSPEWGTMRRERSILEIDQGRNANYRDTPAPPPVKANPYDGMTDAQVKARVNAGERDAMREMSRRLQEAKAAPSAVWQELSGEAARLRASDLLGASVPVKSVHARGPHTLISEVALTKAQAQALLKDAGDVLDRATPMTAGRGVLIRVPAKDRLFGPKSGTLGYVRDGVDTIHLNPRLVRGSLAERIDFATQSGHFMPAAVSSTHLAYTLAHEMGHVIDFIHRHTRSLDVDSQGRRRIAHIPKAGSFWKARKPDLSKYGKTNTQEGYAEAFAHWLLDGGQGNALDYVREYGWHRH